MHRRVSFAFERKDAQMQLASINILWWHCWCRNTLALVLNGCWKRTFSEVSFVKVFLLPVEASWTRIVNTRIADPPGQCLQMMWLRCGMLQLQKRFSRMSGVHFKINLLVGFEGIIKNTHAQGVVPWKGSSVAVQSEPGRSSVCLVGHKSFAGKLAVLS